MTKDMAHPSSMEPKLIGIFMKPVILLAYLIMNQKLRFRYLRKKRIIQTIANYRMKWSEKQVYGSNSLR